MMISIRICDIQVVSHLIMSQWSQHLMPYLFLANRQLRNSHRQGEMSKKEEIIDFL
jgi:hypothetical protein